MKLFQCFHSSCCVWMLLSLTTAVIDKCHSAQGCVILVSVAWYTGVCQVSDESAVRQRELTTPSCCSVRVYKLLVASQACGQSRGPPSRFPACQHVCRHPENIECIAFLVFSKKWFASIVTTVCVIFLWPARPPNGLYVLPITEERANRCLARIDLLNKIREQILWHPWLDARLALCQAGSYLPQWWICGQHDKDLLIGAAKWVLLPLTSSDLCCYCCYY